MSLLCFSQPAGSTSCFWSTARTKLNLLLWWVCGVSQVTTYYDFGGFHYSASYCVHLCPQVHSHRCRKTEKMPVNNWLLLILFNIVAQHNRHMCINSLSELLFSYFWTRFYRLNMTRGSPSFRKAKVLFRQVVSVCPAPSRFLPFAGLDLQKADRGQSGAGTHNRKQVFTHIS